MDIPLFDVHTHLDANHLTARGLHDIALYHMLISDLVSAGCPSRGRLSEDPDEGEVESRIQEAIPYLKFIGNTSLAWGMRMILADLYDWHEPITLDNWRMLDGQIRERAGSRLGWKDFTKDGHPAGEHGTMETARWLAGRLAAVFIGMGVLHPLAMGGLRHSLIRAGTRLEPGRARRTLAGDIGRRATPVGAHDPQPGGCPGSS